MSQNSGSQSLYLGNSYIATASKTQAGMPKPIAKPIKEDGTFTQDTWRYLNSLSSEPNAESAITLGPTPATFQATANGSVLVSGGTVSALSLTRNNAYNLGMTSGLIPLSIGDILTINYTGAPVCIWFPR